MKRLKTILILVTVFFGYRAFASDPVISDVTVRQRWPWSKLVDIDYVLTCDDTVDIVVNGFNGTVPLVLPPSSLSGDRYDVSSGSRRIVWDPTTTDYATLGVLGQFKVMLEATRVPLYMIVDLTKTAGADAQIEYVYESELRAGTWGSWVENPVTNRGAVIESVIWTGVTSDLIYAKDKLVLRRVPKGAYVMGGDGYAEHAVALTKSLYVGVFAVTEAQWGKVMGSGGTSKPKVKVSYDEIRGATNDMPMVNWPETDWKVVTPSSFLGQLRSKTWIADFDLPTEAQWEYLCRAGTTTVFNDGSADAEYTGIEENNNGTTNKYLNLLGWYKENSSALESVGQKLPNAWGLYDMHGNVWERCLDWYAAPVGGEDPSGVNSGLYRVVRGGPRSNPAATCRSAIRESGDPAYRGSSIGFRLVRVLP